MLLEPVPSRLAAFLTSALLCATASAAPPQPTQVRLLTWNVGTLNPMGPRLPQSLEAQVVRTIAAARADVVTLEEVASEAQVRRLEADLHQHGLSYTAVPIVNNPTHPGGRMSATFYLGQELGERLLQTSSGYRVRAVLLPHETIVNVHSPATDQGERTDYFQELIPWTRSLPQPVLLSGDFNLTPTHGAGVATVRRKQRHADEQSYADLEAAYPLQTHFGSTTIYGWPFDHVMGSAGRLLNEVKLPGRTFPQDHRPLLVQVAVPPAPAPMAPPSPRELLGALTTHCFDAVTTPGGSAELRLKLEHGGWQFWRPDVLDYPTRFSALGATLDGTTDWDGVAHATLAAPSTPGAYPYSAHPLGRADTVASGRIWVLDPARPLAVVDIDGTLSDMSEWKVLFAGQRAKAFPGSPQLLRELARTHQVVYLTARDDDLDAKTRAFLKRHAFPDGPVIYNDLGFTTRDERDQLLPRNHGAFKLRELRKLQALGLTVGLGIGNAETDAWAYEQAGVPSYIKSKPHAGASLRFDTYAHLRAQLEQAGVLTHSQGMVEAVSGP